MSSIFWKVAALAWGILLSYLLLMPFPDIDSTALAIPFRDKIVHIFLFLIWTFLLLQVFQNRKVWFLLLFVFLYGIATEAAQSFIPDRSCELLDVVADGVGIVLGVWAFHFYKDLVSSK